MAFLWLRFFPIANGHVRISAGAPNGGYMRDSQRYAQLLSQWGVTSEILSSEGTPENVRRLQNDQADLAFAQGGFGSLGPHTDTVNQTQINTIANVGMEHFWIFTRVRGVDSILQLQGLRIGVTGTQSGSRHLLDKLMELWRLEPKEYNLVSLTSADLPTALASGKVDAVVQVAATSSPLIQKMLNTPGVQLVHLRRSAAIYERLPYLQPTLVLRGSLTERKTQPENDTTLLTTHTSLLVNTRLHPALQRLVTHVAEEVHRDHQGPSRVSAFPNLKYLDFPSSVAARRVLESGLPWWEAYLPYFWGQVLVRLVVICLPIVLIAWWLGRLLPGLLHWRLQSQLNRWYGELKFIEDDLAKDQVAGLDISRYMNRLSAIDRDMARFRTPNAFMHRWFSLRAHVDFVRTSLLRLRGR